MKILMIAQWTIPGQNARANRTWQLSRQLARLGHDVTLYALTGTTYDYGKVLEETGLKVKNLGVSHLGCVDSEGRSHENIVTKCIRKAVRAPELFPGIDLYPMVRRVFESEGDFDLLITIAAPHTIHWATAKYIDRSKVRTWIADCGDPFMGNPVPSLKHYRFLEKRERAWCSACDFITVPIEEAREAYYPEYRDKIRVIPQGFDFEEFQLPGYQPNPTPSFSFAGMTYKGLRDPSAFLDYLAETPEDFRFEVYTRNASPFLPWRNSLKGRMEIHGSIPRAELIPRLASMDFLLNIRNASAVQQPSKLIDYAIAKRPVLDISSEFTDTERKTFHAFLKGDYSGALAIGDTSKFRIENVANEFLALAGMES